MMRMILGRWWSGRHQKSVSPPRQQLHWQSLLWDNPDASGKEKLMEALLSHQQGHNQ